MADFALWATACETGLWPAGTFTRAYGANRNAAIEGIIDTDPIAACVREIMSERSYWTGSAADLLRISVEGTRQTADYTTSPKNPRALAGHLRRAQTFLRALGIEITFSREDRAGSRIIKMRKSFGNTVSTVSSVRAEPGSGSEQHSSDWASARLMTAVDLGRVHPGCPIRPQRMLTALTQIGDAVSELIESLGPSLRLFRLGFPGRH
jgi:hypothetical protein